MSATLLRRAFGSAVALGLFTSGPLFAANASAVVSYTPGSNLFQFSAYTNPNVALGMPQTSTGGGFVVTPFNNPFSKNDVVCVGLGGQLTLQLSNEVLASSGLPQIGVFTFQQFKQTSGGGTDSTPTTFYPSVRAAVSVSDDGVNFVPLNSGNPIAFDIPANAYQNSPATTPSNYFQPFTGGLSSLANQPNLASTLAAYGGSAGGTWLDISGTGLSQVDYIRFTVPSSDTFSFQLDGVSVSTAATGATVPEPGSCAIVAITTGLLLLRRRGRTK